MDPSTDSDTTPEREYASGDEAVAIDRARTARWDRVVELIERYTSGVAVGALAILGVMWVSGNLTRHVGAAIFLVASVALVVQGVAKGWQGFTRGPTHPAGRYFMMALIWVLYAIVQIGILST